VHIPVVQVPPVPQALPHMPQLLTFVCTSTQLVPHGVCAALLQTHAPAWQVAVDGQAWPHDPQLSWLVAKSTQSAPHDVSDAGHAQVPSMQVCVAPQE
jgi:hypothetical protein